MNEYVVYCLWSLKFDKIYIGYSGNLIERIKSHNSLSTSGYTLRYRPWIVIHVEFFNNKREAMIREKYLKTSRGRAFVRQLIEAYHEMFRYMAAFFRQVRNQEKPNFTE